MLTPHPGLLLLWPQDWLVRGHRELPKPRNPGPGCSRVLILSCIPGGQAGRDCWSQSPHQPLKIKTAHPQHALPGGPQGNTSQVKHPSTARHTHRLLHWSCSTESPLAPRMQCPPPAWPPTPAAPGRASALSARGGETLHPWPPKPRHPGRTAPVGRCAAPLHLFAPFGPFIPFKAPVGEWQDPPSPRQG